MISDLTGGSVALDASTALPLTSGSHIASGPLQFNPDGKLSGTIKSAHLALADGQALVASRGRRLTLTTTSVYDLDSSDPLVFSESDSQPAGSGQLGALFTRLEYPSTPDVTLHDGELDARVSRAPGTALSWSGLIVKGQQDGSYTSVAQMPDDEYNTLTRYQSGTVETMKAPNRVMVVNTVPIATNALAALDAGGYLVNATLAWDATIFGVPLAPGTPAEVNAENGAVLLERSGRIRPSTEFRFPEVVSRTFPRRLPITSRLLANW